MGPHAGLPATTDTCTVCCFLMQVFKTWPTVWLQHLMTSLLALEIMPLLAACKPTCSLGHRYRHAAWQFLKYDLHSFFSPVACTDRLTNMFICPLFTDHRARDRARFSAVQGARGGGSGGNQVTSAGASPPVCFASKAPLRPSLAYCGRQKGGSGRGSASVAWGAAALQCRRGTTS